MKENILNLAIIISSLGLNACSRSSSDHPTPSTQSQPPKAEKVVPAQKNIPQADEQSQREHKIKVDVNNYMDLASRLADTSYPAYDFLPDQLIQTFVSLRCQSLIKQIAKSANSPTHLYNKLSNDFKRLTHRDFATSLCRDSSVTLIPGKYISKNFTEIGASLDIRLRADNTVERYFIRADSANGYEIIISVASETGIVKAETKVDEAASPRSYIQRTTYDSLRDNYTYQKDELYNLDSLEGPITHRVEKRLVINKYEGDLDLTAKEVDLVTRKPNLDYDFDESCEITLKAPIDQTATHLIKFQERCSPPQ